MATKRPLRSSEEVYHRLRWDPALPAERVVIGYEDRLVGDREVPLLEFTPGGRIPWSRVWYFRLDAERIWDRRTRMDRLFGSGLTRPEQRLPSLQQRRLFGAGISARPMYRYLPSADAWRPHTGAPERLPASLSLLTLNVLFDDYERERIDSPRRYAAIAALLRERSPDLIILSEVQQPFLAGLLAQPWAQHYLASASPDAAETLDPYGQLILSRWAPSRLLQLRLSRSKRVLIATLETGATPLEVAAVHLTSDRRADAHEQRIAQVERLLAALSPEADHLIVGDFNYGDDQSITALSEHTDVWRSLYPDRPGHTYAPEHNALAALFSQRGIGRRLDRILLHAPPERLLATAAEIVADTPLPGRTPALFPSDHFGLAAELSLGAARAALAISPTTHRAALAVVPPEADWGPLQALRRRHDRSFHRWMPHLNLLYGFVPEALHPAAAALISELLSDIAPRTITLSSVETFTQPQGQTVILAPDRESAAWLSQLQATIRAALPQCTEQDRGGRFTPHLTLAQLPLGAPIPEAAAGLVPWSFPVDAISVLSRGAHTPFRESLRIGLGGGPVDASPPAPGRTLTSALRVAGLSAPLDAAAALTQLRAAAAACGCAVHLFGSTRLGISRPDSDVDVLLIGRAERSAAWSALEAALGCTGRRVAARIPVLKLSLRGVPVDVLYARYPEALPLVGPSSLSTAQRGLLTEVDEQSALGCLEADALLAAVGDRAAVWRVAAAALRGWASARQLDAQAVGYPGGLAWAIIAASVAPRPSPEAWLEAILERLYRLDRAEPVCLDTPVTPTSSPMQIWTSCAPRVNTTASVLTSTHAALSAEVERALELVWQIREGRQPWSALLAPVDPEAHPARLDIEVRAGSPAALSQTSGWLMGSALGLLIELERRVGLPLRPHAQLLKNRLVIGLPIPPEGEQRPRMLGCAEELAERFADWKERPASASLHPKLHG